MKKLWFVVLGSLLGFWLSTGVHAETTHKSIHELPNIVYMDNETIPHGYEEYLYYPFRLAADQMDNHGLEISLILIMILENIILEMLSHIAIL